MSERTIEVDTALTKLARALGTDEEAVAFLDHLPVVELRELQWQVIDALTAADRARLQGVVSASRLLPIPLAATIGEKWFGPVLCARLVGLIEPDRGGQFARHLSADFMADIAARTDPRSVGDLVHHLKLRTMQKIAATLVARDDHLTLSHFVGHLPSEVVASILAAIDDNAVVVRVARYVDDLSHLDPIVALLPDERLLALVRAVDAEDLWVSGLHLFSHLGDEQIARVATTIVRRDQAAVVAALDAFARHDLWEEGLQLVDSLDPADLATFADVLLVVDDDVVDAAITAIETTGSWHRLVAIAITVDRLDPDVAARLRAIVERLPAASVDGFREAARAEGHDGLLEELLGPTA